MEREFNYNGKVVIGKVTEDGSSGCSLCIGRCKEIWEAENKIFPNDNFCIHECRTYYTYKEEPKKSKTKTK